MNSTSSLLAQMPPELQKQVLMLIKRLGDQKQQKQQLQKKCQLYENQILQLKKQNLKLKSKWQNSVNMISKVRENYTHKENSNSLNFNNNNFAEGNNCIKGEDSQQQEDDQRQRHYFVQKQQTQNLETTDTIMGKGIKQIKNNSIQSFNIGKSQVIDPTKIAQQSNVPNLKLNPNNCSNKKLFAEPTLPNPKNLQQYYLPPKSTSASKKQTSFAFTSANIKQKTLLNSARSNKSAKKLQIQYLKQQIQQLSQQIKQKQTNNLTLSEKVKKCEQIKNRYKKGGQANMSMTMQEDYDKQEINSNSSRMMMNNSKIVQNGILKNNQNYYHSPSKVLNFQQNTQVTNSKFKNSNNILENKSPQIRKTSLQQQQQKSIIQNLQQNTSMITLTSTTNKKAHNKQRIQQSFYDNNLLDLIEEMNM